MNGWAWYWVAWTSATFLTFIGPEVWALFTDTKNTLSWQLWKLMEVEPGQPISQWSAAHVLIGGVLTVTLAWLIGHFVWGVWR